MNLNALQLTSSLIRVLLVLVTLRDVGQMYSGGPRFSQVCIRALGNGSEAELLSQLVIPSSA